MASTPLTIGETLLAGFTTSAPTSSEKPRDGFSDLLDIGVKSDTTKALANPYKKKTAQDEPVATALETPVDFQKALHSNSGHEKVSTKDRLTKKTDALSSGSDEQADTNTIAPNLKLKAVTTPVAATVDVNAPVEAVSTQEALLQELQGVIASLRQMLRSWTDAAPVDATASQNAADATDAAKNPLLALVAGDGNQDARAASSDSIKLMAALEHLVAQLETLQKQLSLQSTDAALRAADAGDAGFSAVDIELSMAAISESFHQLQALLPGNMSASADSSKLPQTTIPNTLTGALMALNNSSSTNMSDTVDTTTNVSDLLTSVRGVMDKVDLMLAKQAVDATQIPATASDANPLDAIAKKVETTAVQTIEPVALDTAADTQEALPVAPIANTKTDSSNADKALVTADSKAATIRVLAVDTEHQNSNGHKQDSAPSQNTQVPNVAASVVGDAKNDANSFAAMLQRVNPKAVMEQVSFQFKTAVADGSSKIQIRLDPAELGKLDIKLDVRADGKTVVMITADNKNTLDLLQRDAAGLQRALADAGLQTDSGSLSFNLRDQQQEQRDAESSHAAGRYQKSLPEDEEPIANSIARSYVVNLSEGLDIRI
ncbi:MAG: flagellar hook-length control protein FliK [Rickettsiales bacterium]|nr:flagellar hook-length control protein FliK [Rickettsiales bacterium]